MNNQLIGGGPPTTPTAEQGRYDFAQRSRAARKFRIELFGPDISRELPWDILLFLFVHHEREHLNVSSIYAEVGAPATTALRWLRHLEEQEFIVRQPHATDHRVVYVALSPAGKCTLDLYFDAMLAVNDAGV